MCKEALKMTSAISLKFSLHVKQCFSFVRYDFREIAIRIT